jgi:hypothetical protein
METTFAQIGEDASQAIFTALESTNVTLTTFCGPSSDFCDKGEFGKEKKSIGRESNRSASLLVKTRAPSLWASLRRCKMAYHCHVMIYVQ